MAKVDILLVEDNPGDTYLAEQTFEERSLPGELHTVGTAETAIDRLYQQNEYAMASRPDLILLDLNLSTTNGQDVLREVKSDPDLKRIPVIVLTGSPSETDLVKAYEQHASACLIKPVDPEEYGDLFQRVTEFWVSTAVLPPNIDSGDES